MDGTYTEQILTINNTKLAAVLLTFGARLRSHLPLEWVDEFPDKAAFLAWRRDRNNPELRPKTSVTFNFLPDGIDANGVSASYHDSKAEEAFTALIKELVELGLDQASADKILAAHSRAVASVSHEALDAREWLIERMKQCPETAKWIRVRGTGKGQFALFGKQASNETIAEVLNGIAK